MKKLQQKNRFPFFDHTGLDTCFWNLGRKLKDESIVDYESHSEDNSIEVTLSTVCMKVSEHSNIAKVLKRLHDRYPDDADVYALLFLFEEAKS